MKEQEEKFLFMYTVICSYSSWQNKKLHIERRKFVFFPSFIDDWIEKMMNDEKKVMEIVHRVFVCVDDNDDDQLQFWMMIIV